MRGIGRSGAQVRSRELLESSATVNQLKLGEGMRLSRREKDVAGPSVLSKGKTALEGVRRSSGRGRSKPGEPAPVTAPASSHLFHLFCFLHPFFLFWFLFPVISFSCTGSAYNHYRVNFLSNYVVNLFLYPEYKAWNVLSKYWVN